MKLYIYKNRIYHQCVQSRRAPIDRVFYSFEYNIRSGEAKCPYCSFIAPGFLFIGKVIFLDRWLNNYEILPEGGKWLEL